MGQRTERTWEGEALYEAHPEISPEYDEGTEELFKVVELPSEKEGGE